MGMGHAESQVRRYAKNFKSCNQLVASTGGRYQLYVKKSEDEWNAADMKNHLAAYLNLLNLKERHPYLANIGGAPDLFTRLMPR